jgi:hypothetical protein
MARYSGAPARRKAALGREADPGPIADVHRRRPQIFRAPISHSDHDRQERSAFLRQRIVDPRRHDWKGCPVHEPVLRLETQPNVLGQRLCMQSGICCRLCRRLTRQFPNVRLDFSVAGISAGLPVHVVRSRPARANVLPPGDILLLRALRLAVVSS